MMPAFTHSFSHSGALPSVAPHTLPRRLSDRQPTDRLMEPYSAGLGGIVRDLPGASCEAFASGDAEMAQTVLTRRITVDELRGSDEEEPVFDRTCQNTPAVKEVKERARRYSHFTSFG